MIHLKTRVTVLICLDGKKPNGLEKHFFHINGDLGPFEYIFKDARAFVGGELDVKRANLSEPEENIGLSEEEEEWEDYNEMDLCYTDPLFSEIWNILHNEELFWALT
jgi:hypothetical protein